MTMDLCCCVKRVSLPPNASVNATKPVYLKITLPALVADGAVQRVVHQQELHHTLPVINTKKTCPILTVQAFLSTNHLKVQGQQEI